MLLDTPQSDDWHIRLDNGNGYMYKYDKWSDGTYVELVRSTNWQDATGEGEDNQYFIEIGTVPLTGFEPSEPVETLDDLVYEALGYWGVESNGGDMIVIENDPDTYIEENYT